MHMHTFSILQVLDACFQCDDATLSEQVKSRLEHWMRAFIEATSRKKHVPLSRLNKVLTSAVRDLQRGHVVADDIEAWTPAQVRLGPRLAQLYLDM
jgi:hypothetical protein